MAWLASLDRETTCFCRFTQIGFLRLLTHPNVMSQDVCSQAEAWVAYDTLLQDPRVFFVEESDSYFVEPTFRKLTSARRSSSKQWPDAYLVAFSQVAALTLVTFDRGLREIAAPGSLLLT
jgi:predicted nucleic acid-binding protein